MAFTGTGGDLKMVRNPSTGRFDFEFGTDGNPTFDDTEAHRVLSLLVERRGRWWADATGRRGSRLHEVREIRRTAPSELENFALEALQKAVDEGKIRNVTARATRKSQTRIDLDVRYETPGGKPASVRLSIGV